jgi:hypothetical protein
MRLASGERVPEARRATVMQERRIRAVRAARTFARGAFAVEMLAILGLVFDARAVVLGTLACAVLASCSFYGAYEGFDEALRRPK